MKFDEAFSQGQAKPGSVVAQLRMIANLPNGSSTLVMSASDMPLPLSDMTISTAPAPVRLVVTTILPPSGVNFTALVSRLSTACRISRSSAWIWLI